MKRLVHPSRKKLEAWLDRGDPALDRHLDVCSRCATRLEDLSAPATPLGRALTATLAPRPDLHPRLREGIARKMASRDDLQLLFELLGLPWQTARAMNQDHPDGAGDRSA